MVERALFARCRRRLAEHALSRRRPFAALWIAGALALAAPAAAQVSPGPLASAHGELDQTLLCLKCHARAGSMSQRCLACHTEIAWLVKRGRGFHARETRSECASCHPDHAGRDFKMISWTEGSAEKFDHHRSGWPLEGRHATLKCLECHKPEFQRSPSAALIQRKHHEQSWLGLESGCVSCHSDPHRSTLGADCQRCHNLEAWRPAPRFDHAKTDYALTGKHAQVKCEQCHRGTAVPAAGEIAPGAAPTVPVRESTLSAHATVALLYKPLEHHECVACHRDPHQARFGAACSSCHSTAGWAQMSPKTFNHDLTRYPLRGRHAAVACAACHDPRTAWGEHPPFASCGSCHKDAHAGQATLAGKPADCVACHSVEGFSTSTFTVAQHARSAYPLAGKHAQVKCASCHAKNPPGVPLETLGRAALLMRPPHDRCASCHADAHGGQLAVRADHGACESCHAVAGWKPSTFTAHEHATLKLALEGRHAKVECMACHGATRTGLPPPANPRTLGTSHFAFALTEHECVSCHFDPHHGRFGPTGERTKKAGCLACHGLETFHPSTAGVAEHHEFGFALEGAHRAVPCLACHEELKTPPATSSLLLATHPARPMPFSVKSTRCEACHASPHGDQFAQRRDHGACESCHVLESWHPAARFDHNRDASFKLEGAHARVACANCHISARGRDGKPRVIYRPLASKCESCHGNQPMKPLGMEGHRSTSLSLLATLWPSHEVHHGTHLN